MIPDAAAALLGVPGVVFGTPVLTKKGVQLCAFCRKPLMAQGQTTVLDITWNGDKEIQTWRHRGCPMNTSSRSTA